MVSSTWEQVRSALIREFGSDQTLSNQKQSFMAIHLKRGENPSEFADRFYREAQVLSTCGKISLDDAITAAVSAVSGYAHLQLYLKGIKRSFRSILNIKEALQDIPPNLGHLHTPTPAGPSHVPRPRIAAIDAPKKGNPSEGCTYCKGKRHTADICFKRRAEEAEKALST